MSTKEAVRPCTEPYITVPDISDQLAVVTGNAGSGLALNGQLALAGRLALAGAEVVLPVRNPTKGKAAAEQITAATPAAARCPPGCWISPRLRRLPSLAPP